MEALKCTKVVKRALAGTNMQGKVEYVHEKCGEPAAEYTIGGALTQAKAVLCQRHKEMADRQNFISKNGYRCGEITPKLKKTKYQQERLPGTGVL